MHLSLNGTSKNLLSTTLYIIIFLLISHGTPLYAASVNDQKTSIKVKQPPEQTSTQPKAKETKTPIQQTIVYGPPSLSFSVSPHELVFEDVYATNPLLRQIRINAYSNNFLAYAIYAYEDVPPTANDTSFIPDTTCDAGNCTEGSSGIWKNTLTYGFGYRCEATNLQDCKIQFPEETSYRPFGSVLSKLRPLLIGVSDNQLEADIVVKVNTANTQKNRLYTNTITLLAVPHL